MTVLTLYEALFKLMKRKAFLPSFNFSLLPSGKTRSFEDDHPRGEDGRFTFKSGKGIASDEKSGIIEVSAKGNPQRGLLTMIKPMEGRKYYEKYLELEGIE